MSGPHPSHPAHQLPDVLRAVLSWGAEGASGDTARDVIARRCGPILNVADFDATLHGGPGNGELGYRNHPFEMVPFAWNGSDGLSYGWALLDEALHPSLHPCVSFAPGDEGGVRWLGDTTVEALENMMVGGLRYWQRYAEPGARSPLETPEWTALCSAAGLRPQLDRSDIEPGGRSKRRTLTPHIPSGHRFEPSPDGTGVLAPSDAFGPSPIVIDPAWYEADHIAVARGHLDAGHPAAALLVLKATRAESDAWTPTVVAMRDAYLALDRPFMAARAQAWLAQHDDVHRAGSTADPQGL